MSNKQNDRVNEAMAEAIQENEMIMLDAHETFDADNRDGNNGTISVESVNEAAFAVGEITMPEYQRNRVALEKMIF